MKKFAERTGLPRNISLEVQWGRPEWAVVSWAREHNVDLIVMGSHSRHGPGHMLGSTSSSVLHQSPCGAGWRIMTDIKMQIQPGDEYGSG